MRNLSENKLNSEQISITDNIKKSFLTKLLLIIIVFITAIAFTGCAKVSYSFIRFDDNTILQQLKVELDSDDIESHNASITEIKEYIEDYVENYHNQMISNYNFNLRQLSIHHEYRQYITYLQSAVQYSTEWLGNTFYYNLQFKSVADDNYVYIPAENIYYFYYTGEFVYSDDDEDEIVIENELFTRCKKQTITTSFDGSLCDSIEQNFLTKFGGYGFTLSDVAYIYNYGQKYGRLHSDADKIYYDNGVYVHSWNLSDKAQEITLYRTYANQVPWYILAVIIGLLVAIVFVVVGVINSKKRNKSHIIEDM